MKGAPVPISSPADRLRDLCCSPVLAGELDGPDAELLARLDSHRLAGELERLAIFAAPDMLGILRAEMPRSLRSRKTLERAQNLMPLNEAELREVVKSEIRELGPAPPD